jgi:hypothetical protein
MREGGGRRLEDRPLKTGPAAKVAIQILIPQQNPDQSIPKTPFASVNAESREADAAKARPTSRKVFGRGPRMRNAEDLCAPPLKTNISINPQRSHS